MAIDPNYSGNSPSANPITPSNKLQKELFPFEAFTFDDPNTNSDPIIELKSPWKCDFIPNKFYVPIGFVYFQGPHDAAPDTLFEGTWEDVSYEEANLARRAVGSLSGTFFVGTPAVLAVSVTAGVPTITITSGGSGYLSGGSGTIPLTIVGACTTPMVATASVTNGVLTAINVTTAGAGYTSGKVAVYDKVVGHGDIVQRHEHRWRGDVQTVSTGSASAANNGSGVDFYINTVDMISAGYGNIRSAAETSGAWVVVTKWRRIS